MNEIRLLIVPLGAEHAEQLLLDEFSPAERHRYDSIRPPLDRRRYLLGHGVLRRHLGRQARLPASEVPLDVTCSRCGGGHGRPRLTGAPEQAFRSSISHAGEYVAVAIGQRGPIGVDLEPDSAADWPGFDEIALTAAERAVIAQRGRPRDRTRLWTRKEAVLKSLGHGLREPLDSVTFDDSLDRSSGTVAVAGRGALRRVHWLEVAAVPGYSLALAAAHEEAISVALEPDAAQLLVT